MCRHLYLKKKPRDFTQPDLRLGPGHCGFYLSSTLSCPFCLLEAHPLSFTAKAVYSRSLFTHILIFTEHNMACGCYWIEDHSSAEKVKSIKSVQLETSTTKRLKMLILCFDTYRYNLAQWCTCLWPHLYLYPGTQPLHNTKHWCAQTHSRPAAPICSEPAAISVNSF